MNFASALLIALVAPPDAGAASPDAGQPVAAEPAPAPVPTEPAVPAAPPTADAPAPSVPVTSGASPPVVKATPEEESPLEIHAFGSEGGILTTGNNYLVRDSKSGSFEMAEAGVNFTKSFGDRLRIGMQLFARHLGEGATYTAKFDWFYVDYRLLDWLGFRVGRVKIPYGLYNEILDIDQARTPILLPQSTYPLADRDFLLAQTGAEIYGYRTLGAAGGLEYRVYAGTIVLPSPTTTTPGLTVESEYVPLITGARLLWDTPVPGLRVGGSVQGLRLDATFDVTPGAGAAAVPVNIKLPAILWVSSAEYVNGDLLLSAEYGRWHSKVESSDPAISPVPVGWTDAERGYVMASYAVTSWLRPGAYYSVLFSDVDDRSGNAMRMLMGTTPIAEPPLKFGAYQHDVAGTLRFDVTSHLIIKLEGHFIDGTADVDSSLNGGVPLSMLAKHWAVFLTKVTGYF